MSNVEGWGSPLGFSATNMRYVTITKSRFYNNAAGIVPNALDSEKYPPAEDNAIIDNDIFWNNFNFHQGKPPFAVRQDGTAALVPVGTGILLLGGRGNLIENNRIYGNFLTGVAAIEGILLAEKPDARSLERNVVHNNQFGLDGTDANGFDVSYDGNGNDNCFSLAGVTSTFPAVHATFAGCGGDQRLQQARPGRDDRLHRRGRADGLDKHPHPAKAGYQAVRGAQVSPDPRPRRRRAHQRGAGTGCREEDDPGRRQLLLALDPERRSRHHGHLALAGRRGGGRRARRRAHLGPEGREEVPLRGGLDGVHAIGAS